MRYLKKILLIVLGVSSFAAQSKKWGLGDVIQTALKQSYDSQIIESQKQSDDLIKAKAYAEYDFTAILKAQFPKDITSTNKFFTDYSYILQKKWITGSQTRMVYCHSYGISYCGSPFVGSFTPPSLTAPSSFYANKFSFQLEQGLLRNAFGREDRLKIKVAKSQYKAVLLSRKEDVKKLILTATQNFWNSYTAYTSWKQAQQQARYYKKLVRLTRKKKNLGHIVPGEIPQIQSQYERALNFQKTSHTHWKNTSLVLQSFLQTNSSQFYFKNSKPISMPKFKKFSIDSLNVVQMAKNNKESLESKIKLQKYYFIPYLKLKAQIDYSGQDRRGREQAFEQLKAGDNKFYSVGLDFVYPIPASTSGIKMLRSVRYKEKEYELNFLQTKDRIKNQIKILWNTVQNARSAMKTAESIARLQNKALVEVQKSYEQGRISINDLISAQDRKLQMELEKVKSQKEYDLAAIRYLSVTDELTQRYIK